MKKNIIKALWPEGGEIVELILENDADVREYALLDASRLIQHGGRWDMERVGTDDEMMDPIELERTKRLGRPRGGFSDDEVTSGERLFIDGELENFWGFSDFQVGRETLGDAIVRGIRRLIGWRCTYVILNRKDNRIHFQAGAASPYRAFTEGHVRTGSEISASPLSEAEPDHLTYAEEEAVLRLAEGREFPPRLAIANWNVARLSSFNSKKGQRVELFLRSVGVDTFVLTETSLAVKPGPTFASVFTDGPDAHHKPDERWAAIHSRFPIEQSIRTLDPSGPWPLSSALPPCRRFWSMPWFCRPPISPGTVLRLLAAKPLTQRLATSSWTSRTSATPIPILTFSSPVISIRTWPRIITTGLRSRSRHYRRLWKRRTSSL